MAYTDARRVGSTTSEILPDLVREPTTGSYSEGRKTTMQIGGIDVYLEGKVSDEAPEFLRRFLGHAWPNGVVENALVKDGPMVPLREVSRDLWTRPSELLAYKTREAQKDIDYPYPDMLYIIINTDGITLVAGDDTLSLAKDLETGLRFNRMVR